ncbi:MAG: Phenylacetate-CoA ligase [Labilithrix sp.]|nr:Phenylacetate-CoA ligase [Labilithrix sp.]
MDDPRSHWRRLVRERVENDATAGDESLWCPRLETLSRTELEELQSEKIEAAFELLLHGSAFYRAKLGAAGLASGDVRTRADLHKVPVTLPGEWMDDQQANPPWGTFSPLRDEDWLARGWMLFTTSGTKAAFPRAFRHTSTDRELWAWHGKRALHAMGVRRGDIAINCFAYGTSVAFWGLHHALGELGIPVISGGGATTERRVELIRQFKPTVLLCTPSYALHLGRALEETGRSARESSIRRIVLAGEPGASVPATRRRLRELWGAVVHDDFGCTEVAMSPLGYTCAASENEDAPSPHLMEDQYVVECLTPGTWTPVADGELGVLVVSNLFSEAQPILRYVMGDWLRITREPCACGRTHARALGGLQGRYDDVVKVKGLKFYPAAFEDAIRSVRGTGDEFKVEIEGNGGRDVVTISVEPADASEDPAALLTRVERGVSGALGINVTVRVLPSGTLPRTQTKAKRFFDLRRTEETA